MVSGIYEIRNKINNKRYIGSSVNIARRIRIHFWKLRNNNHNNVYLQNAFNKYGESAFESSILECVSKEDLITVEQTWINQYDFESDLYNLCPIAYCTTNRVVTDETRKKMSTSNARYWKGKKRREETNKKISETLFGRGKPVRQLDKYTGEEINVFPSVASAARSLGVHGGTISKCARKDGIHKSAYGYIWEYVND